MSIQDVTNSISFSTKDYSNSNLILSTWRGIENISENVYYNNKENSKISYIPKTKKILKKKIIPINNENIPQNFTPFQEFKTTKKLSNLDLNLIPTPQPTIKFLSKMNTFIKEEKRPQDSKKKNIKKGKFLDVRDNEEGLIKRLIAHRSNNIKNKMSLEKLETRSGKLGPKNSLSKKKIPMNSKTLKIEDIKSKNELNLKEFGFGKEIGKGTFGKIFSVKWNKDNKLYAMKKEKLSNLEDVNKRKKTCVIIQNFIKETYCKGIVNLYGNLCLHNINSKNNNKINNTINHDFFSKEYIYYELMEKCEKDWDTEISKRSKFDLYYTENEIINIMTQLIKTLSLLQKRHITHRDIKPQNILVLDGIYKLCDFGEIRVLKREGLIVQRVRGSELYMSPILFNGLHKGKIQVEHNTYKSDVFSLGMCLFYASTLTYGGVDTIRELNDMDKIKEILFQYMGNRYSFNLISFILSMLEINESKRLNFIELEDKLKTIYCD